MEIHFLEHQLKNVILSTLILVAATTASRAAEFDINGLALGMNAEQVVAKYQELRPDGQSSFSKWKLSGGTEWVANGQTLYNDLSRPDDMEHERMKFAFTGLGSGNKLFAVRRELKFKPSERPATNAVYEAAVKKFGEPSYANQKGNSIWAAWKFTAANASAEKLKSSLACIGKNNFPVGLDDHTAEKAKKSAASCGLYVEFSVRGTETGLATELDMAMMNHLDLVSDFEIDNQDARKRIDAARATNASSAAHVPKL